MALTELEVEKINDLYNEIDQLKDASSGMASRVMALAEKVTVLVDNCNDLVSLHTGCSESGSKSTKKK
tara:strand:- start:645 stop:848 length:204 start_codon:yes stop_codon:yes gene_type:complete